jgi:hypothetical protein
MSLSRDSCQGWPGAFPASFLLPLYFLVYVSSYSLGPYPRIDCYFRLRSLTSEKLLLLADGKNLLATNCYLTFYSQ